MPRSDTAVIIALAGWAVLVLPACTRTTTEPSSDVRAKSVDEIASPSSPESVARSIAVDSTTPSVDDDATSVADPISESARLVHDTCKRCERAHAETCVSRVRASGEPEHLGCGEVSPSGRFAVLSVERGSTEDESWELDYVYVDADGKILHRVAPACSGEPGFDCDGPGWFLAIQHDRWLQRMGNAGDGTNDQKVWDLLSGREHPLPEGEYTLIAHANGTLAGFYSRVPNVMHDDGDLQVRHTLGCFDFEAAKLHVVWETHLSDEASDAYLTIEPVWDGDELVLADEGKELRRVRCPERE